MKRSEALKIIDNVYGEFVDDWLKLNINDDEQINNFKRLDERILSALEDAGMLPPRSYLKTLNMYDNGWESEDEEK
jgi:hypothetical protein